MMIWSSAVFAFFVNVYIVVVYFSHGLVLGTENVMDVELKQFSNCEEYSKLDMMFKDLALSQVAKKKFVLDGGVELNVPVTDKIMAAVTVIKCDDSSGEDSCELMGTVREENFCDKIGQEGTPWYEFMAKTDIGTKCPIDTGIYKVKEAPLNIDDAEGISLTPGYWKLRMEVFNAADGEGSDPIGCNVAEVSVKPSRGKY